MMLLSDICELLECQPHTARERLESVHIQFGCASDLMSDVLAFSRSGAVLLTGLVTVQTIQTAFIADISAVVFVRGKKPNEDVLALARQQGIPVLSTPYSMYEACGLLYQKGLPSTMERGAGAQVRDHHDR
jgi:predicted transcriptional regulator